MPRLTRFEEYRDRYPDYALEKTDDGILLMRMHRDGGPAVWDERMHHDTANLFNDVAGDRDLRVVIYTGTGENFNANWGQTGSKRTSFKAPTEWAEEMAWYGRLRHINLLEIDAIMIAAVNGPANIHSELAFLCDIVLASEDAYFQDLAHFPRGMVPGDGQHVIWPAIIGRNRARYLLLTGKKLSAQEALTFGQEHPFSSGRHVPYEDWLEPFHFRAQEE
jgi:enoyl-CoA hydratase/carnithine racemase